MKFLSVCSGIEAASVAWRPLGWQAVAFAEIEKFPAAVLRHHYPDVENRGDMTRFPEWPDAAIDVLVGGTPCQSFSVAGLRKGLADPRGNLALTYLAVLDRYRPRWMVWENVPGALSVDDGRALGAFLGGLSELGYGWAYRSLDAQYFRLAQRRRRVFIVGHLGDWRRAAAVLFERASLSGHPAPRREAGQAAPTIPSRSTAGGGLGTDFDCDGGLIPIPLQYAEQLGREKRQNGMGLGEPGDPMYTLECRQPHGVAYQVGDSSDLECRQDGTANAILTPNGGRGGIGVGAIAFDTTQITHPENRCNPQPGDPCHPLASEAHAPAIAFRWMTGGDHTTSLPMEQDQSPTLDTLASMAVAFADVADPVAANQGRTYTREGSNNFRLSNVAHTAMQVRRLTPRECERLQGFPDDYTLIPYNGKPAKDGPRYKALGNSMAVPVMRWIGQRIAMVDSL